MTRTDEGGMPPDECFQLDDTGQPMTCTQQPDGSWTPEPVSDGPDPLALAASGSCSCCCSGWSGRPGGCGRPGRWPGPRASTRASAGRMALVSEDGLTATYLASSMRGPTSAAPVVRDTATRLRELDRLRSEGLVTEGEHASRRAAILAEI